MSPERLAPLALPALAVLRSLPALTAGVAVAAAVWAATSARGSWLIGFIDAYEARLEARLRRVHVFYGARRVMGGQAGAALATLAAAVVLDDGRWLTLLALVAVAPGAYLDRQLRARREALEEQLDGFVLALANALKASPNVGSALLSLRPSLDGPMRQELDLMAKELSLGTPLGEALTRMAARIGSRSADAAIGAVLVGRRLGGNLPEVLETTAGTLREMRRLDGVVRAKTAEGKAQLWVVGALPFALVMVLGALMPGFLDPLTESLAGGAVVTACVGLWLSAVVLARKILQVDA